MSRVGLRAVSLDKESIKRLKSEGVDVFRQVRNCEWSVIIASPERLTAPEFDTIVRNDTFRLNIVLYVVDEVHVLRPWSLTFRKAYEDIPQVRLRIPLRVPMLALTATLLPGPTEIDLLRTLRFRPGFHVTRCSSEQANLRLVFQTLSHGLDGSKFPDFAWVAEGKHKVILYCKTIDLSFRLASYLWRLLPPGRSRFHKIRLYNSLIWPEVNEEIVKAIDDDPTVFAVVATIKFAMGIDVRKVTIAASVGLPDSAELGGQERGRAGRDRSKKAAGITYVEKSIVASIKKELDDKKTADTLSDTEVETLYGTHASRTRAKQQSSAKAQDDTQLVLDARRQGKSRRLIDAGQRRLIAAHVKGTCLMVESNSIFGNAHPGAHLSCSEARRPLPCSSCLNSVSHAPSARSRKSRAAPSQTVASQDNTNGLDYPDIPLTPISRHAVLTKEMKAVASSHLDRFSLSRWKLKDDEYFCNVPHQGYLPSAVRHELLSSFHMIRDWEALAAALNGWDFADEDLNLLFREIQILNIKFDDQHIANKKKRGRKQEVVRKRPRIG